ncbi:hypothetical protein, partial [Microbacterium sp. K41]|uniref:hypothetical protein n=1 Tax=Microbacterium sp. K41 TaxID=2305437 RepID=UPI00109C43FF
MTYDNDIIRDSITSAERFAEIFERHITAVTARPPHTSAMQRRSPLMDIFDQVREIRPTYPPSPQAPRRALHQEIARSRRSRPLRRIAVVSLGG